MFTNLGFTNWGITQRGNPSIIGRPTSPPIPAVERGDINDLLRVIDTNSNGVVEYEESLVREQRKIYKALKKGS